MRTLVLKIPAPTGWISSNQRMHRMAQAKLTAQWREAGLIHGRNHLKRHEPISKDQPVHITAHIIKPRAGRYDPNNLWPTIKALVDGLVDSRLIFDDDHQHVIGPDMRHGGKGDAAVVLTITEINQ